MRAIVGCEFSGVVRRALRARGVDAWSCDWLESEDNSPYHIRGDLTDVLRDGWDLGIFHPPCTYMSNSGVCHLHTDSSRWLKLAEAAEFFLTCWSAPITHVAVENPVMHKYAKEQIGGIRQSQVIQPWMFGHKEGKQTCLWLKNLPLLKPTNNVKAEMMLLPKRERQRLHYLPPGPNRWRERSRTYSGIADAMAEQWTAHIESAREARKGAEWNTPKHGTR